MKDVMKKEEIRSLRKRLDLTAKELAEVIGVTENTVNRWEMGVRSPTTAAVKTMRRLEQDRAVPA